MAVDDWAIPEERGLWRTVSQSADQPNQQGQNGEHTHDGPDNVVTHGYSLRLNQSKRLPNQFRYRSL